MNLNTVFVMVLISGNGLLLTPEGSLPRVAGALTLLLLPGLVWADYLLQPANRLTRWVVGAALSYALAAILGLVFTYLPGPITLPAQLVVINLLVLLPIVGQYLSKPANRQAANFSNVRRPVIILLVILIMAAFFRLAGLGYSEFQGDEGRAMISAAEALEGHQTILFIDRRKGPAEVLLPMMMWRLTGTTNELVARLPFAVAGLLLVVTIYLLGRDMLNEPMGLIAAGLITLNGFMVAFSRIVQYQNIVIWMSAVAVLCVWYWRKTGYSLWPALAGLFIGTGLLAHYDTVLVIPALAYLALAPHKTQTSGLALLKSQVGPLLAATCLLLIIVGLFYIPYLLNPQLTDTQSYLNERIGQGWLKNSLGHFLHYSIFYNSFYYLLVTGLLVLGFLASTLAYLPFVKRIPAGRYWLPLLTTGLIVGFMLRPEALRTRPGLDLAFLPFTLLIVGALFSPALTTAQRAIVVWLAVPFIGYNFTVADPKTHFYTTIPAWGLLAALGAVRLWQSQPLSKPKTAFLAAGAVLLVMLFSGYLYLAYLRQSIEYVNDWPAGRSSLFWAPAPYNDLPETGFFGFVHRTGWKAAGGLYAMGKLNGSYYSNEKEVVTVWYTRNALRKKDAEPPAECRMQPDYYVVADQVDDPRKVNLNKIQNYYSLIGRGQLPSGKGITIYEVNPTLNPSNRQFDMSALARAFDRAAKPAAFIRGEPQNYTLNTNFSNLVRLSGYTLDTKYARPGGRITITLNWLAQAQIPADLLVFVHVEDQTTGTIGGQSNSRPVCGLFPTYQWPPGQTIPDQHVININPETPPGDYQISVGMYHADSNERLNVLNETDNTVANSATLITIPIQH